MMRLEKIVDSPDRAGYRTSPKWKLFAFVASLMLAAFCCFMWYVWGPLLWRSSSGFTFQIFGLAALYLMGVHGYWRTVFGPSVVLTPTEIIHPGTFGSEGNSISPDTQIVRWDRSYVARGQGDLWDILKKSRVETSILAMDGGDDKPTIIVQAPFVTGRIEEVTRTLERIAAVRVQHLTPDGMVSDPLPLAEDWPEPPED